ncbi:MAG: hypothetical protein GWN48_14915, partial [Actinobacteria bacterium]|nr:hypothetical protein [Actinomycetota bacterium]
MIGIEIGPEVPSAEGPKVSDGVARFAARTYAPLRVEDQSCERSDPCDPDRSLSVWFNNALDPESIDVADIGISPEIPGSRISVRWNEIDIQGATKGNTVYEV